MKNKRILITGGAGSIGSELARQLCGDNKVYCLDFNEAALHDLLEELHHNGNWIAGRVGDIRNYDTVADVFSDFKPEIIFHAAAYKSVDMMEITPLEAIQTNCIGTHNVIHCARRWECTEKFVFISSDKAVQSNSIMGISKKMGEVMTTNQGKGFIAVRFGNVLGSRASVIPIWQRQINQGKSVTVTDPDMTRFFMTIQEACHLVIEAAENGSGGEVFILDMGEPIKIIDLAERIIKESRANVDIKIIGKRPGEVLHERLMTNEEEQKATKKGNFYVLKS